VPAAGSPHPVPGLLPPGSALPRLLAAAAVNPHLLAARICQLPAATVHPHLLGASTSSIAANRPVPSSIPAASPSPDNPPPPGPSSTPTGDPATKAERDPERDNRLPSKDTGDLRHVSAPPTEAAAGCPFAPLSRVKRSSSMAFQAPAALSTPESADTRHVGEQPRKPLSHNAFWRTATVDWPSAVAGRVVESETCFGLQGWADAEFNDRDDLVVKRLGTRRPPVTRR
jgi:hypothetical protein